jgi:hypothetical protein
MLLVPISAFDGMCQYEFMPACNAKVCYRLKFELIKNPQIITDIRAMFRKESTERSLVAINELICDVVATWLGELKSRSRIAHTRAFRRHFADFRPTECPRCRAQHERVRTWMPAAKPLYIDK